MLDAMTPHLPSQRLHFLALAYLCLACGSPDRQSNRPETNVIIVTWDTVGADMVTEEIAPFFNTLGDSRFVFSNSRTVAPLTLPAHTSLMSGLYPHNHGARHNGSRDLGENVETIASVLKSQGWLTGAFVSASVLNPEFSLDRGFDIYSHVGTAASSEEHVTTRSGSDTVEEAVRWMASQESDKPIFMWVHMFDAHRPWTPSPSSSNLFESPYFASIRDLDNQTSQLLSSLSSEGRLDDAIIVITADHGEGLGRDGEWTHGYYTNDSTMRIPLLFAGYGGASLPFIAEDSTNQNSSIVDVAPTLLQLLNLESEISFDGKSLFNGQPEDREVLMESLQPALEYGAMPIFAVTDGEQVWDDDQPENRRWPITTEELSIQEQRQLEALGYLSPSSSWTEPLVDPLPIARAELMTMYQSGAVGLIPSEAITTLRSLEERWGTLPPISSLMVRLMDSQGLRAEADTYTESLSERQHEVDHRRNELERLLRLKELIEAALAVNPDHESAHYDLGMVLWQLGDIERAEANFKESVDRELNGTEQSETSSIPTISTFYAATNRTGLALEAIEQLPLNLRSDCHYGRLLLIEGRRDDALLPLRRCADSHGVLSNDEVVFLSETNDIGL
jgi:tetratricopeptide (TPR) repeat protein